MLPHEIDVTDRLVRATLRLAYGVQPLRLGPVAHANAHLHAPKRHDLLIAMVLLCR